MYSTWGREQCISLYVLADSGKLWINQEYSSLTESIHEFPKPPDEIWNDPPENIQVENYYFNSTLNKLVDLFITETGSYPGKEIRNLKVRSY